MSIATYRGASFSVNTPNPLPAFEVRQGHSDEKKVQVVFDWRNRSYWISGGYDDYQT